MRSRPFASSCSIPGRRFRPLGWLGLLCLAVLSPALAEENSIGLPFSLTSDYAGTARSAGLASANLARVSGTEAVYENPAGLGLAGYPEISLLYLNLFESTGYDFIGVIYPWPDSGTFGLGWARLSSRGFTLRDPLGADLGSFDDIQNTAYLSYGRMFPNAFGVGGSLKLNVHDIHSDRAAKLHLDVAARYDWPEYLSLAAVLQNAVLLNLTPGISPEPVPIIGRLGLAWSPDPVPWGLGSFTLFAEMDAFDLWNHGLGFQAPAWNWKAAAEYELISGIRLLGGWRNGAQTLGLSVTYHPITLDYAFDRRTLGNLNWVSLTYWLATPADPEQVRRLHEQAMLAYSKKDFAQAIAFWSQILQMAPRDHSAAAFLEEAKRQQAQATADQMQEALQAQQAGDLDLAEQILKQSLSLDPANAGAVRKLDEISQEKERRRTAERAAKIEEYLVEANRRFHQAEWMEALHFWELVLELEPGHPEAVRHTQEMKGALEAKIDQYFAKGVLWLEREYYGRAIEHFTFVLKIVPGHLLANHYLEKSKHLQAQYFQRLYPLAVRDFRALKYETSLKNFRRIAAWNPSFRQTADYIQRIEQKLKSLTSVLAAYGEASKAFRQQDLSQAEQILGALLENPKQVTAEILKLADRVRERRRLYRLKVEEGLAARRQGDFQGAIRSFGEAVSQDKAGEAKNALAQLYTEQGIIAYRQDKLTEAIQAWENALQYENSPAVARYLARAKKKANFMKGIF